MDPARPRGHLWATSAVGLVVASLVLAPVLSDPTHNALGRPCSEAGAHLWGLWTTAQGLPEHGPLLRVAEVGFPGAVREHLIDPIHLLAFGLVAGVLGGASGAVAGWNALHLGDLVVAAIGCALLARVLGLRAAAAGVLMATFAGSSALLHQADTGRSELFAVLWLPLALAGVVRCAQAPGRAAVAGAGVAAGLLAWGGPYNALFGGLGLVAAGAGAARSDRPAWGRLLAAAAVAGVVAAPALWALWAAPPANIALGARATVASAPLGALFGAGGALGQRETTPYVGLVALALATAGATRGRLGAAAAALAAVGFAFAVGPAPTLGDTTLGGPAAFAAALLPPLRALSGWTRLSAWAALPLGIAAAAAVDAVGRPRLRFVAGLVCCALLLADQQRTPRPAGDRSFRVHLPADAARLYDALPPGPVLDLPGRAFTGHGDACEQDAPLVLWAPQHGRPTSASLGQAADGLLSATWLSQTLVRPSRTWKARVSREPALVACAAADRAALADLGVVAIVLHRDLPRGELTAQVAQGLLGPADVDFGDHQAWTLQRVRPPPPRPPTCPPVAGR